MACSAKLSFLAHGTVALAGPNADGLNYLVWRTLVHLGVMVLLFIAWRRQWELLFATLAFVPPTR